MKKHNKTLISICIMLIIALLCACGNSGSSIDSGANGTEEYKLRLIINYDTNLIFARYDVDISVDKESITTLTQGGLFDKTLHLKSGTHSINIKNTGDKSVDASCSVLLNEDTVISFTLKAHEDSIDIIDKKEMSKTEYEKKELEEESKREEESKKQEELEQYLKELEEEATTRSSGFSYDELKAFEGKTVLEAMPNLESKGYTSVIYIAENTGDDFTSWFHDDSQIAGMYVIRKVQDGGDGTLKVTALSQEMIDEQESKKSAREILSSKIEALEAWWAMRDYGESIYGDDFELHYILGNLAEEAEDENTWFLKAECTLPSGYRTTCEARITGTYDYPEVIYWYVYE